MEKEYFTVVFSPSGPYCHLDNEGAVVDMDMKCIPIVKDCTMKISGIGDTEIFIMGKVNDALCSHLRCCLAIQRSRR